uniref:F-box protein 4 n=1 Tax=Oryzias sinensis TaxID=183150 RepID=A0A8C7ZNF8_9TELE
MTEKLQQLESVVIRSLRLFRDRYFPYKADKEDLQPAADQGNYEEKEESGFLESLPVGVQFQIMTFLSPSDICRLGATSQYWRAMVRDSLLWRYFLLRDTPGWSSIDHVTMPNLDMLDAPLISVDERLDDREEGDERERGIKFDYMSEYLKGCPSCRQKWLPSRPAYAVMTSFLQYIVRPSEPRYAMFGPGMEQLDVSLVTRLMHAHDVLPVASTPCRQTNGIGSGISYMFKNQHKFNILTLYSTNRAERERARVEQQSTSSKLFTVEGTDDSGNPLYSPTPYVQKVCQVVDGFIYVANAESDRVDWKGEVSQIRVLLNCAADSASRPLLVLSCVAREQSETINTTKHRTPCVSVAKRLGLPQLSNPWMVQDTVAESLSGLLDGISWLLRSSGVKLHDGSP